ncbi:DUF721 domain-containing protein [Candidatus Gracilibacteria bacterium]|nr:DUF721 domain-containing protein [Candidatus Gracilibacteria bacterium]
MFTPLAKILPAAMVAKKMMRQVTAAVVCEKFRQAAPQIIHPEILTYVRPLHYKGKTLTIGVESSSWAHKIIEKKDLLMRKINDLLRADSVTTIKTKPVGAKEEES